nr:putative ribonuclease H-like domain-containing protein [Tanacetum cinerariifolium]
MGETCPSAPSAIFITMARVLRNATSATRALQERLPKLKNKDEGNVNAQGWVYAVGNAEKKGNASWDPDSNVIMDPKFPNKVYKVAKDLYGLHQASRAWYDTLSTFLEKSGYKRGAIDNTLFIKQEKKDIMLVQVYVDDINFGSTKKSWCDKFEELMKNRFQLSSMGELTFFLGLQVKQKEDGIFISHDKYVAEILKNFDFLSKKTASTAIETQKPLVKDEEAADVDVHLYRSMIGSLMYLTTSRPDIMFAVYACSRFQVTPKTSHLQAMKRIFRYLKGQPKLGLWYPKVSSFDLEAYSDSDYAGVNLDMKSITGGCQFLGRRLISWQCKKQTIMATSTIEVVYVAAAHCCRQVLWIQNQLFDDGFNFMNTKIYIDNESKICIVKNLIFHSKTKHIEIRHHFIRDGYENKQLASPKQKAFGKDISNPLMAGRLPKTTLPTSPKLATARVIAAESIYCNCMSLFTLRSITYIQNSLQLSPNLNPHSITPTFAKTHNLIAYLAKPTDSEGFKLIIDFLDGSSVSYALTTSPTIRTSCIKQFWTTAKVKTINDECLSAKTTSWNEFSSTMASLIICLATNQKFNFSRYILLSLVKTIEAGVPFFMFPRFMQLLINHQLGDMSHHKDIYDNPSLKKKVFANMKRVGTGFSGVVTALFDNMLVPATNEVGLIQDDQPQAPKVFSPEPSPEHKLPSPSNDPLHDGKDSIKLKQLIDLCTHLSNKYLESESEVIDIKSSYKERIEKLEGRVDKLEEENRFLKEHHNVHSKFDIVAPVVKKEKSFKQGRIIADIDEDVEINLEKAQAKLYKIDLEHPEKVLSMQDVDDEEPANVKEVLEVVKAAKLMTEVVATTGPTTTVEATKVSVLRRRRDKGKGILIEEPKSLKGPAQIEQDEAFARQLKAELNAYINWNVAIEQVKRSERLNDAMIKYQALKRKPLTKAQARKNMIIYLKNMAGFKMNYFKEMTYSEIRPLFEKHFNYNQAFLEEVNEEVTLPKKEVEVEAYKREGESLEKEITKKQKMDEEAEELISHLKIMSNDDDDVYIEATPLASKIHIVDYNIHFKRNKPYFKIIRADGNHMLFLSFNTMLKNFDIEDLESL